ncbi:hypothetical protein J537_0572 [Acinetobacter baumannii 1437282]|nr:hypothetical protein J537_0572 [Acinetobacter baumannii 1437282]
METYFYFKTYLLIAPYIFLILYFYHYKRDKYFYKTRSSIQLLFVLYAIGVLIFQLLIWKGFLEGYNFLGFSLISESASYSKDYFHSHTLFGLLAEPNITTSKLTPFVAFLSAIMAVGGWIFTSRIQIINATKTHAMQVLMNSRTSTAYVAKVDEAMKLRKRIMDENGWTEKDSVKISSERYLRLTAEERSAVHYLLNFLEFIAVGVRHSNLDEEMIKGSFKSILTNNYLTFHPIIEHIRKSSPSNYVELEVLHKRWDEDVHRNCDECKDWFKVGESINDKKKISKLRFLTYNLLTCMGWGVFILGRFLKKKAKIKKHKRNVFICVDCGENIKNAVQSQTKDCKSGQKYYF